MYAICVERMIPEIPDRIPESVKSLLLRCFSFDRFARPNAFEVVHEFLRIQVSNLHFTIVTWSVAQA
jgi:hypothetical protein